MATLPPELLDFMADLAENNDRDWFKANKGRYDAQVKEPALGFIRAIQGPLMDLSPHFVASDKGNGGSLFRIYRDTRFSKDKSPYKTHTGMQFRHAQASRDVHAPGFYIGLEPGNCMLGAGMWHPERSALLKARQAVVERPDDFLAAKAAGLDAGWERMGESLKRAPKGFDPEHALIEDLRYKDWALSLALPEERLGTTGLEQWVCERFEEAMPWMRWLGEALELPV